MKCPNCGAESNGRYCSYCGSEMPVNGNQININHNEKISHTNTTNNYYDSREKTYDDIYEEEKMRANARNRLNSEAQASQAKGCLITFLIFIGIIAFIWWKITSWWDGVLDNGRKKTDEYVKSQQIEAGEVTESESGDVDDNIVMPRETDEIIDLDDYVSFWENYSDEDEHKWYRTNVRVYSISNDNTITARDGLPEGATAFLMFEFNSDVDLSNIREGDSIQVVGFSSMKIMKSLTFEHCYIE